MILLTVILIFVLIVASTWWFGLWSNLITLINLLLSGLVASSFFENVAAKLQTMQPSYKNLFDFISIWLVFIVTFIVIRGITDTLSRIRLKFDYWTETIGRSLLSIWIACVFIAFTLFTFHLAPLPPSIFSDPAKSTLGIGPDKMWAAFIQSRSRGALAEAKDSTTFSTYNLPIHPDDAKLKSRVFDPFSKFIPNNLQRRIALSKTKTLRSN